MPVIKTGVSIPADVYEDATRAAKTRHLTFSGLVTHALRALLDTDQGANHTPMCELISDINSRLTRLESDSDLKSLL